MCLKKISNQLVKEELQIQNTINNYINEFKHIKFNAGAGAGKTYALIESLKYIVKNHSKRLQYHNQNIICITYTNVATNEIKERLGNSTLVKISTIHERLWSLIQDHQEQLLEIHKENLEEQLVSLRYEIYMDESKTDFRDFRELTEAQRINFIELMKSKKDIFYQNIDKRVAQLRIVFEDVIREYPNILTAKTRFEKVVKRLYKINNLSYCLEKIERKGAFKILCQSDIINI